MNIASSCGLDLASRKCDCGNISTTYFIMLMKKLILQLVDLNKFVSRRQITSLLRLSFIAASLASLVIVSWILPLQSVEAQKKDSKPSIKHGIVVGVEKVDLKEPSGQAAAGGALIGGILGRFTSTSNRSSGSKRRRGLAGAALGGMAGAIGSYAMASEGTLYTVKVGKEELKVITDQKEIRMNECVTVEQTGKEANIRRAPPEVCDPKSKAVVEQLKPEFQEEADECLGARKELLAAESEESIDKAIRKVKILCGS